MNVYILRGFSGAGKSSIARQLASLSSSSVICSADDGMVVEGEYVFDPKKLPAAHAACREKFYGALRAQMSIIVVDNTAVKRWEWEPYRDAAVKAGANVFVLGVNIPGTEEELEVLEDRGSHEVPPPTYQRWYDNYQR